MRKNEWIKERLEELEKTAVGLAAAMKVAGPRITDIYKGERKVKGSELAPMAEFLEMSVDEVMKRLGYSPPVRSPNQSVDNSGPIDTDLLSEIANSVETTLRERQIKLDAREKFLIITGTYEALAGRYRKTDEKTPPIPLPLKNKVPGES
jgi:hypothetical protein